jgi:type I restriction enzyme M protein
MAVKKSELYSSLWKSCYQLRGGMDASQYKNYVLVLLFVKYVSDKYAGREDALLEVPEGGSFQDMVRAKGQKDIGDKLNKIIAKLAEANNLGGVINVPEADFNDDNKLGSGQEMVDRLTELVAIFENPALDFTRNRAEGDDLLGDAYEYLMRHFATESGKSKGQFYTPTEVSRVMAKIVGVAKATSPRQRLYDPTCGSGSLLLKAADEDLFLKLSIYEQEMEARIRIGRNPLLSRPVLRLQVRYLEAAPKVQLRNRQFLELQVRPSSTIEQREQLKEKLPAVVAKWEPVIGEQAAA